MSTKRKTRRKDRTLLSFKKERKIDLTGNYSAPPMGMSNRLTVVLQQELH